MSAKKTRNHRVKDIPETQKRSEVLSVKASVAEKDMIVRAAARYRMPYSEFVRYVALGACRNMGIEERPNVEQKDVRRRRVPASPVAEDSPRADAPQVPLVA